MVRGFRIGISYLWNRKKEIYFREWVYRGGKRLEFFGRALSLPNCMVQAPFGCEILKAATIQVYSLIPVCRGIVLRS